MEIQKNEELSALVRNFGIISNTTISIYDANRNLLASWPDAYAPFCSTIRENAPVDALCTDCDLMGLSKCYAAKKPYLYHCHMGLVEIASPIMFGDTLLGYILIGQFTDTPNKEHIGKAVTRAAEKYNFSAEAPLEHLESIVYRNKEYTTALTQLIEMCANYIWLNNIIKLNNSNLAQEIRLYIAGHLTDNLSIDSICAQYSISSTGLYQLFQKAFGCGAARIIQEERIKKAQKLLLDTKLSISDVAAQVGILDTNYFTRLFKAQTGITPKNFRNHYTSKT